MSSGFGGGRRPIGGFLPPLAGRSGLWGFWAGVGTAPALRVSVGMEGAAGFGARLWLQGVLPGLGVVSGFGVVAGHAASFGVAAGCGVRPL